MGNDTERKDFETIIYEKKGKIASLTLDRPEKHSALSYQLIDNLDASLNYVEADVVSLSKAGLALETETRTLRARY